MEILCHVVQLRGYHRESLVCKGEILKKNTRGITKHHYFTEGKSYLTRKIKVD
jgi:hypothetical protein